MMVDGVPVIPNTTSDAVADVARRRKLTASLAALVESNALGYPAFSAESAYEVDNVVFYDRQLWKFKTAHAIGPWNAEHVETFSILQAIEENGKVAELQEALENGDIIPLLATNFEAWAGMDDLSKESQWNQLIRTTAGSNPIVSEKGGAIMSIIPETDHKCSGLRTSAYNQLKLITEGGAAFMVGNAVAFPVDKLTFGELGTAKENNGVLFTNSEKENQRPTVYFKPLASGVPASATDGTLLTLQSSKTTANQDGGIYVPNSEGEGAETYSFYLTPGAGWLIVNGITRTDVCAHVAWEDWYDRYIGVDDVEDAGDYCDLAALYAAAPNGSGKFLVIGSTANPVRTIAERISKTSMRITDPVGVAASPVWTNTADEVEEGATQTYTHSLVISTMKSGGVARINGSSQELTVDRTTVKYQDENATAIAGDVYFEKAAPVTVTVNDLHLDYALNDCGFEIIEGAVGSAFFTAQYANNYPDAVAELVRQNFGEAVQVIAEALCNLDSRQKGMMAALMAHYGLSLKLNSVDAIDYYLLGTPKVLKGTAAGAPAAANVPENWDETKMGKWVGGARREGQQYISTDRHVYYAVTATGSTNDWVPLN